ncbi:glycoside hydrolase family 24 protein [Lysobacter antibioticus]|uniref:Phage lysozyme family protein n=1 Tax=Lysobacter antibioticus TaxID=84531 RepID=A0A0S2F502_LYSAN|nr:glycoside hydrolase family 104 protein [Lysobacter antibioticus]ALN78600.1 phage lysozyme family protein [Lysobacter antibioticus]
MARLSAEQAGGQNVLAFLDMIAHAEGVERFSEHGGYDVLVGGGRFTSYAEHPRKMIWLPKYRIHSTAAGRYQFLWRTWNNLRNRLKLPDFGPASQDRGAIELLSETGALADIKKGWVSSAVRKSRKTWASLPDAGYGQREVPLESLLVVYQKAGGQIA